MLPIQTLRPTRSGPLARASGAPRPTFAVPECDPAAPPAAPELGTVESAPPATVPAQPGQQRDRRARQRGETLLDALRRFQRSLLTDQADMAGLRRLGDLAVEPGDAADPRLQAAVAEIALRARIEMARYEIG